MIADSAESSRAIAVRQGVKCAAVWPASHCLGSSVPEGVWAAPPRLGFCPFLSPGLSFPLISTRQFQQTWSHERRDGQEVAPAPQPSGGRLRGRARLLPPAGVPPAPCAAGDSLETCGVARGPSDACACSHPWRAPASLPPSCAGASAPGREQRSLCGTRRGLTADVALAQGEKRNTTCRTATYFAFN